MARLKLGCLRPEVEKSGDREFVHSAAAGRLGGELQVTMSGPET